MNSDFSLFAQKATPRETETPPPTVRPAVAVLALGEIPGVGHATAAKLYGDKNFQSLFSANRDEVQWIAGNAHVASPHTFAEQFVECRATALEAAAGDLERYEAAGIELLLDSDARFPASLRAVSGAPRWLFVRGNADILNSERLITVVGTRKPTSSGIDLAGRVTSILVGHGFVTVSGLAEGIDSEVHRATIDLKGQTVAVLGAGIFDDFPAGTAHLRQPIIRNGGAIITEYFPKERFSKQRFVQRNRIQAALSSVTIPVEAAVPSGTFHTVRFAREYRRTVLGVKWEASADTPLHQYLREIEQAVVEVSREDDPFLAAIGQRYNYIHFLRESERARRKAQQERMVRSLRHLISTEHLSDFEVESMFRQIRENRAE